MGNGSKGSEQQHTAVNGFGSVHTALNVECR
jgi:hypothetical protein